MNRLGHYARQFAKLAYRYPQSLWLARRAGAVLERPQQFCFFVGYPRSGHSIIGSLLDAHPDMVIARELDVMQFLYARFGRRQILAMVVESARRSATAGRRWRYSYRVPTQWQGRFRELLVIGDKHGEATTLRLQANPELLERLRATIPLPLKLIHVVRNPYDNIATIAARLDLSLAASADYYFGLAATVQATRSRVPAADWRDVRHEEFVADPRATLEQLCRYLGVDATPDYLADCAAIVYDAPNRSRLQVEWPDELRDSISRQMSTYPHFGGYTFER